MDSSLPGFTEEGLLPPGDYELTFAELRQSLLVMGPDQDSPLYEALYEGWNTGWREHLTHQAETMCESSSGALGSRMFSSTARSSKQKCIPMTSMAILRVTSGG